MVDSTTFISVKDIMKTLSVSESKAYSVVRELNKELTDKGYMVIPGKVSRKYFEERFYGVEVPGKEEAHAGNERQEASYVYSPVLLYGLDGQKSKKV